MEQCWNAFCIAESHPGDDRHVDCTGYGWTQRRGMEYNPRTGNYDRPYGSSPHVFTVYERFDGDDSPGESTPADDEPLLGAEGVLFACPQCSTEFRALHGLGIRCASALKMALSTSR